MKKGCFLYFLLVSFFTNAQIINFSDANLKAKLLSANPSNSVARDLGNNSVQIDTNSNNEIEVSEALQIGWLNILGSNISDLSGLENFSNLKNLQCNLNQISSIDLTPYPDLTHLSCAHNLITSLNLSSNTNLTQLSCGYNPLTAIDVSMLTDLRVLEFQSCNISSINLSNQSDLIGLNCTSNQLTSLNLSNCTELRNLFCPNNLLTALDLTSQNELMWLNCNNNQITSLDLSSATMYFDNLSCQDNSLISINIKNGLMVNWDYMNFSNNPNLQFICADEEDVNFIQQKIDTYGYTSTCHVNSYCSFTPGGTFYDIEGNVKFDSNSNGCDVGDLNLSNLNLSITDGTTTSSIITDTTGDYFIPVQAGIYTIATNLENPSYFNISPSNFTVDFPTDASPYTQDFCVTANGMHSDVEVTLIPMTSARPGFDAVYKIIYRNKGTEIESGSVSITFDETILDYVDSNPVYNGSATNTFTWSYTNLLPFETKEIEISFNVNSQTETPNVNIGDVLNYTVSIVTSNTDETPADNTFTLNQTVVGSYDPNDKRCLEGESVTSSIVGEYVHYVIRFENTGTYLAQNIVVKDMIDTSKFDVLTLVPLHASHQFYTRIKDNKVEFIFENINLDFNDATNDGYVAFKIKTLPILTDGDTFSNEADIYFDYNYPIVTNEYLTTIDNVLNNEDFSLGNVIKIITTEHNIEIVSDKSIRLEDYTLYNISGQEVATGKESEISTLFLANGIYILKLDFDEGSLVKKVVVN